MDNLMGLPATTSFKSKDDFIQQAHQARQARELARRRETAATTIQAFIRATLVRNQLKRDACGTLDEIVRSSTIPKDLDTLSLLRRLIFVCDPKRDRSTLDSLLHLILQSRKPITPTTVPSNEPRSHSRTDTPQSLIDDAIKESIELSREHVKKEPFLDESFERINFVKTLVEGCCKDAATQEQWLNLLERILNLCLNYLKDASSARLDSQHINTYMNTVNLLTSSRLLDEAIRCDDLNLSTMNLIPETINKISDSLSKRTSCKRKSFFKCITTLICEKISRFRNDLKTSILNNYIQLSLGLLDLGDHHLHIDYDNFSPARKKELSELLTCVFCIPGLIYNLEKHTPESLKEFNNNSVLDLVLLISNQEIPKLCSIPSVCFLANLIHLAALNEETLTKRRIEFVILATSLLESCQKNMLQITSAIMSGNPRLPIPKQSNNKKYNNRFESMDVSFNPILGWLVREQVVNMDKDVLKTQLSHLWSMKILKILFKDLIQANENLQTLNQCGINNKPQSSSPKHRGSVFGIKTTGYNSSTGSESNSLSMSTGLFRRAMERATTTMTRTINSSYSKTNGSSGTFGSSNLTTTEANRIALVCLMLHTALKTLTTLKQDILTQLCLYDYILPNLWKFISSLGPQNGLRAFLDHLALYTKSSAPEFHLLTLFCECGSHLISILDDSELYEKQEPFRLEDLVAISAFLNNFVFRVICNSLVPHTSQEIDPILQTTHKLLTDLYKRDCRRKFVPRDHWLIKDIKISIFLKDLDAGKPIARTIMTMIPHIIPHKERVMIFRKLVSRDKAHYCTGPSTLITIHRSRIVNDGYQQLVRLPPNALKGLIRVKFINDFGLDEAGIDQDGVFKEFLEDTIKRVFDPALNLFCSTSEQRLYPSPTSRLHEDYLSLFNFVGKMLGKAIYEGIVVDVPFATFFLSRVLGQTHGPLYSPIDELPSLDPELYKSLTYIKHYEGDVSELDLTFSIDQDFLGKIETHELELGGKSIPVTRESRVRYIHSVANFRMKTQIEKQTEAFVSGFKSIINLEWLSMFSASEFQRLISGDNTPIDLQDLRRHTKYFGGFHNNHRVVCWLWDILERDFSTEEHKLFLKFVTSCSKPPLLGFANLEPPFSIRCVEVSDDQDLGDTVGSILRGFFAIRRSDPVDRLPTSSTCFNLLKLPNYQRRSTLREKLRYAIQSNPGFELS